MPWHEGGLWIEKNADVDAFVQQFSGPSWSERFQCARRMHIKESLEDS